MAAYMYTYMYMYLEVTVPVFLVAEQTPAEREEFVQQTTSILEQTPSQDDDVVDGKRHHPNLETAL